MKKIVRLLFASALLTMLSACSGKKTEDNATQKQEDSTVTSFYLDATIKDSKGMPLEGVKIAVGGNTYQSDTAGHLVIPQCATLGKRFSLRLQKDGYFDHILSQQVIDTIYSEVNMIEKKNSDRCSLQTFDAKKGTHAKIGNAMVEIPQNALMDKNGKAYDGKVDLSVVYYNPDDENFQSTMPGGDLMGRTTKGENAQLVSYGMLDVEMRDTTGGLLQLQKGKESTLTMPIPKIQKENTPDTIPLWWFDEDKGLWIEEGCALHKGNQYVGRVKHFTIWNCDALLNSDVLLSGTSTFNVTLTLKFLDQNNNIIPNAKFKFCINPLGSNNTSDSRYFYFRTNGKGRGYLNVPDNFTCSIVCGQDSFTEDVSLSKKENERRAIKRAYKVNQQLLKLNFENNLGKDIQCTQFVINEWTFCTNCKGDIYYPLIKNETATVLSTDYDIKDNVIKWKDAKQHDKFTLHCTKSVNKNTVQKKFDASEAAYTNTDKNNMVEFVYFNKDRRTSRSGHTKKGIITFKDSIDYRILQFNPIDQAGHTHWNIRNVYLQRKKTSRSRTIDSNPLTAFELGQTTTYHLENKNVFTEKELMTLQAVLKTGNTVSFNIEAMPYDKDIYDQNKLPVYSLYKINITKKLPIFNLPNFLIFR